MICIEAVNELPSMPKPLPKSVFLAGGITGCPDWQKEILNYFWEADLIVYNPRREVWPDDFEIRKGNGSGVTTDTEKQIMWEHKLLRRSDMILFWFPEETLCPITLFELGNHLNNTSHKPILIGCHPNYKRILDVEIQTKLINPNIKIVNSIKDLAGQVLEHI